MRRTSTWRWRCALRGWRKILLECCATQKNVSRHSRMAKMELMVKTALPAKTARTGKTASLERLDLSGLPVLRERQGATASMAETARTALRASADPLAYRACAALKANPEQAANPDASATAAGGESPD